MFSRKLAALVVPLILAGGVRAQSVDLTEGPLADNFFRIAVTMKLKGETRVQQEGSFKKQPLTARAEHEFIEKVLEEKATDNGPEVIEKSARIYRKAQAVITHAGRSTEKTFRPGRNFLVVQRKDKGTLTYCPSFPLTREELDLTEHFNTLTLTGLLPGKQVKIGDTWTMSNDVAQVLCGMEGLIEQKIVCKLEAVKDHLAKVSVTGNASGIELGSAAKVLVIAHYQFDVQEKRIVSVRWGQSEERDPGPASPGLSADVEITLERSVADEPAELHKVNLGANIPAGKEPPAEMTRIASSDPANRYELQHSRDWIMTRQDKHHTVLRYMKEGALIAQATVTPWPVKLGKGKMLPYEDFVKTAQGTTGWEEDQHIKADDDENVDVPNGLKAYRHAASGQLDGRDVIQYFYLLAGPNGDHVIVTFTMNKNQVKDLGVRDLEFVRNVAFPAPVSVGIDEDLPPETPSRNTPKDVTETNKDPQ